MNSRYDVKSNADLLAVKGSEGGEKKNSSETCLQGWGQTQELLLFLQLSENPDPMVFAVTSQVYNRGIVLAILEIVSIV